MEQSEHIRPLRNMLREIAELAEHASLTGSLEGGEASATRRYNSCLRQLRTAGIVPDGLFEELDEATTTYGRLGVDARLLASTIDAPDERRGRRHRGGDDSNVLMRLAPFVSQEDLAKLVRRQLDNDGAIDLNSLTHLAPFLDQATLGMLLEAGLEPTPRPAPPAPPSPPSPPEPPEPAPAPQPAVNVMHFQTPTPPQETLDDLIIRLSQPHLTAHERLEIAKQIASRG